MGFANYRELVDAELDGKTLITSWRKRPSAPNTDGVWFDLSMSPGNPVPNYYASSPNVAQRLAQSTDSGIFHGAHTSPIYLKQFLLMADVNLRVPMLLCDYLLYYPFIDMSVTDVQALDNTNTLPRYADGRGVQIMAVQVAGQSGAGNPQFAINYVNQSGKSKTTPRVACGAATFTGSVITSGAAIRYTAGPFIPLAPGDTGVRRIESVVFATSDVGLISLVLVKPLATTALREQTAPVERDYAIDFASMPEIQPDAYLNIVCHPTGSLASQTLMGTATFVWN